MGFVDSEQRLHDLAIADAGCDDFGDPTYLEGFRVLLKAYDCEQSSFWRRIRRCCSRRFADIPGVVQ